MTGSGRLFRLTEPSRFAGLTPGKARAALLLLAAFLLLCLSAIDAPSPPAVGGTPATEADDRADVLLYDAVVDRMRHGEDYYLATADLLRTGSYPLRPFVTFRMPTLATVQSSIPPWAAPALIWALAAAAAWAWLLRLWPVFASVSAKVAAFLLLASGLLVLARGDLTAFHEAWAGLLIALSLALRRPGRWMEAAAFGLAAMLVRETAALYVGVMAAAAWVEGERREAVGWAIAAAVFAAAVAAHAHAVAQVVRPLDPASPGWSGLLGFGFFVRAMTLTTPLALVPAAVAAPLVGLAMFGWASWRDGLAARVLGAVAAYALLLMVAARVDTFYWALLIAAPLLVGLAFAPDGLRDLVRAAALPRRRRITVTRVVR